MLVGIRSRRTARSAVVGIDRRHRLRPARPRQAAARPGSSPAATVAPTARGQSSRRVGPSSCTPPPASRRSSTPTSSVAARGGARSKRLDPVSSGPLGFADRAVGAAASASTTQLFDATAHVPRPLPRQVYRRDPAPLRGSRCATNSYLPTWRGTWASLPTYRSSRSIARHRVGRGRCPAEGRSFGYISSGSGRWSVWSSTRRCCRRGPARGLHQRGRDRRHRPILKNVTGLSVLSESLARGPSGATRTSSSSLHRGRGRLRPLRTVVDINDPRLLAPALRQIRCRARRLRRPPRRGASSASPVAITRCIVDSIAVACAAPADRAAGRRLPRRAPHGRSSFRRTRCCSS